MPARVVFDPYSISRELELRVGNPHDPSQTDLEIDWIPAAAMPEELAVTYELSENAIGWRQLAIELSASLPDSEFGAILPQGIPPDQAHNDVDLVVSARCPSTKARSSVVLSNDGLGRWTGELTLSRNLVGKVVELRPTIVRTTSAPSTGSSIATDVGSVIAEGHPIRLVIDQSDPPIRGALEIRWEDFRESTHPWRGQHPRDVQYLEFGAGDPRLWLNKRYTSLKAALHSKLATGSESMLKNMGNALLAQTAWMQMAVTAIGSIHLDEDTSEATAPEGWRSLVLEILGPRLLPVTPEQDRLAELAERFRDPDRLPSLMTELGTAIQEQLPTYKRIEAAIKAGEAS